MLIKEILAPKSVEIGNDLHSKKAVLEHLAEMLEREFTDLSALEIFDALLARERLGSTGLGKGVAIPHGRMPGISETRAAFLQLPEGVDFDAVDNQPVDLFLALLVPEEATDEHLQMLARLAEMFAQEGFLQQLREQQDPEVIHELLTSGSA